jgi:RNA-directed DNA polymerase
MQHARDRIRDLTGRRRLGLWPERITEDLNRFLRGWAAYFKYGHSAQRLSKIRQYARMRLALFVSKKHRRSRGFGWRALVALIPGRVRPDQPVRDHRRTQGGKALAGQAECRR